jgi:hypothetical protein
LAKTQKGELTMPETKSCLTWEESDIFSNTLKAECCLAKTPLKKAGDDIGVKPCVFYQYTAGIHRWPFKHYRGLVKLLNMQESARKAGLPDIE